ncbi:MAG: hypothetical protein GWO23_03895, partial [Gammaproteobacteria bacterium]|nr:hypothetical protein [Gammaproteobacteria bacterium]
MGAVSNVLGMLGVIRKSLKLKPLPRETKLSLGLMIEQQAAKSSDKVMVVFEGNSIT